MGVQPHDDVVRGVFNVEATTFFQEMKKNIT
jgi:hypothetical protein